jgi:predicted phage terminase large subunit-like protein
MDYIIASLDPAYTEKKENDPSALTVWGVWQRGGSSAKRILSRDGDVSDYIDDRDTVTAVMLMDAWEKRVNIHGSDLTRLEGETNTAFEQRKRDNYGLVEHVISTCNKYNVDMLLIEAKGPGLSVAQEIQRLNRTNSWGVHLINPGALDKQARAYAIQPIFAGGQVFAPDKTWSETVITQAENFPKAKHDDLVDSMTQALKYLRERNFLKRPEEQISDIRGELAYRPSTAPVYDV